MHGNNDNYVRHTGGAVALILMSIISIAAISQPLEVRSAADVQADLGHLLGCPWEGTPQEVSCTAKGLSGRLFLTKDASGHLVETIEFMALSPTDSKAAPDEMSIALKIIEVLFPTWKQSSRWSEQAIRDVFKGTGQHLIKVGGETILVQAHHFGDVDGNFAEIVITNKSSIDEFREPSG